MNISNQFTKGDIVVPIDSTYPRGALRVAGYEDNGTLLAYPLGGGFQYRLNSEVQNRLRLVPEAEARSASWQRARFEIDGVEAEFHGWSRGLHWNGWAMPSFEHSEALRVIELMTEGNGYYRAVDDCFVSQYGDEDVELWHGETITLPGGETIKVYGIGAGSWCWDEKETQ